MKPYQVLYWFEKSTMLTRLLWPKMSENHPVKLSNYNTESAAQKAIDNHSKKWVQFIPHYIIVDKT